MKQFLLILCLLLCACSDSSDGAAPLAAADPGSTPLGENRAPVIENFEFQRADGKDLLYTDKDYLASLNGEIIFTQSFHDPDGNECYMI